MRGVTRAEWRAQQAPCNGVARPNPSGPTRCMSRPTAKVKMSTSVRLALSLLLAHGAALAQTPAPLVPWARSNRYLEVAAGAHQQDFREVDLHGLTVDGVLDAETGRQNAFGAALRWQTDGGPGMSARGNRARARREGSKGPKRRENRQNPTIFKPQSHQMKTGGLLPLAVARYSDHP
mgnify:CR=1 FL=1